MHRFEAIDLGVYRGDDYFLVGFVEPDPWRVNRTTLTPTLTSMVSR